MQDKKVKTTVPLRLIKGLGCWLWACADCGIIFGSTPIGERPEVIHEECPFCGAKVAVTEDEPDAK